MITYDTETVGLHGPIIIIQWCIDDGPINIHEVWTQPIFKTLELIEMMMDHEGGVCGFNLVFDHFHLCQTYTTLSLYPDKTVCPENIIEELALLEKEARDGPCLKPKKAFDVMLEARRNKYQSLMERSDIRIKRVPTELARPLSLELEKRVKLKDIYFAKRKNKYQPQWQIFNIEDEPNFKDLVLKFRASSSLKALAVDALEIKNDDLLLYGDVSLDKEDYPKELGYAPFALAIGEPGNWNGAWPEKIDFHINHWANNKLARRYAEDDVKYTRALYKYFGFPEPNDNDSILACAVAASRWRGFKVDLEKLKALKSQALQKAKSAPTAPAAVRQYVFSLLDETERIIIEDDSTRKGILETISEFKIPCYVCLDNIFKECNKCNGTGIIKHPAAIRAEEVIEARTSQYEINIYDKLLLAERFHPDFNIIGTLSSRMSGGGGINAQGIQATKEVRSCFPLAFSTDRLCIGDFSSFEVSLADAAYYDPKLRELLLSGVSPHGLFGTYMYPPLTYDQIMATKGTKDDKYKISKNCLFTALYGGEEYTLQMKYKVSKEAAENGLQMFFNKEFPEIGRKRKQVQDRFCSMHQEYPHGKVEWSEPADYVESLFGFRRYYTLENKICKALFDLAEKPPKEWTQLKIKVTRRDREQSVSGAVRSALFAAAFAIQAANMRSAGNHVIQSSGATLTKGLQCKIWELQPSGINDWVVQTLNVHDEVAVCCKPQVVDKIENIVNEFIENNKAKVPLLSMEWKSNAKNWSDK